VQVFEAAAKKSHKAQEGKSKLAMIYVLDATLVDVKRAISDLTKPQTRELKDKQKDLLLCLTESLRIMGLQLPTIAQALVCADNALKVRILLTILGRIYGNMKPF
jgi:hypothetical protein